MDENFNKLFKGFRFPPVIIQYAIWLHFAFPLSFRDVELLLADRGIRVSHENDPHLVLSLWACSGRPTSTKTAQTQ